MHKPPRFRFIYLSTILALLFSLTFTFNVVADDTTPTPSAVEETTTPPPSDTPLPTETPISDPTITDTPVSDPTSADVPTSESILTDTPVSDPTVTELLSDIPDNTSVVLTADNEIVPLVTPQAAEIITNGDPIWCPAGTLPAPGINGCTGSYSDLASLLYDINNAVISEPNQDGTIWITSGTDPSSVNLDIDGSVFTQWSNFSLTLQGGWDGSASGTITGTSTFTTSLSITNWSNNVTLNQIIIDGASSSGLDVSTDGSIFLTDVTSSNNAGYGADLSATGDIALSGSNTFDNNLNSGLYVTADGDINADNITANGNGVYGAELYSLNNVNITGNNNFNNNSLSGLYIEADTNVNAESITASNNGDFGAEIYSANDVNLTGTNTFDNNGNTGLNVDAGNTIVSDNLNASGNAGNGVNLNAQNDVSVLGTNLFVGNTDAGLQVKTNGSITAENLSASNNGDNGVTLQSNSTVTITGTNVFTSNKYSGLYIEAGGDTLLESISANGNGTGNTYGSGVELYTLGSATLSGTNTFINNFSDGITIDANGNIYLSNFTSSDNGASGLSLQSTGSAEATCGTLSNNTGYEIDANLGGLLTLNGLDFGNDVDNEIAIDPNSLVLNSNSCYTYPTSTSSTGGNSGGSNSNNTSTSFDLLFTSSTVSDLPINKVAAGNGQIVTLDCNAYQGTLITLPNGDGVYIPCPIIDSAKLVDTDSANLPAALPDGKTYVSSYLLTILTNGTPLGPVDVPGSVWYVTPEQIQNSSVKVYYWNGSDWIEISDRITPFMDVFFKIPTDMQSADLALLYWDGTKWIEIAEPADLGSGYLVKTGGHRSADGLYFTATLNFTGTFVLVNK